MGKYIFIQNHLWPEMQNYFLKPKFFLYVKPVLSLLQTAKTVASKNLIQLEHPWITQLLSTQNSCSKQYNLRPFSLTRVQKYNKASSEIDYARIFAFVFDRAQGSRIKVFRCPATIKKIGAFRAECAQDK